MVSLSHNFIISLGVTAITSTLIFFYFRQKMNQMEYKLNTLFQLIQNYTAESQAMQQQHDSIYSSLPTMNNSTNIDTTTTSKSLPVNEEDLIDVSDNNDNDDDDEDNDDDDDDDDSDLSSSDDDDDDEDEDNDDDETSTVQDLNDVSIETKVINLVDNIETITGSAGIHGIIEINNIDVIKEPEQIGTITTIEDDNQQIQNNKREKTIFNTLDTLESETIDIVNELIGATSTTTTTEDNTNDTTISEVSEISDSLNVLDTNTSLRQQLDALDYKKFNVEKLRSLVSEYNLAENVKNIKKKQLVEILDTVQ